MMEDGLVRTFGHSKLIGREKVLILVVMEDGLVPTANKSIN